MSLLLSIILTLISSLTLIKGSSRFTFLDNFKRLDSTQWITQCSTKDSNDIIAKGGFTIDPLYGLTTTEKAGQKKIMYRKFKNSISNLDNILQIQLNYTMKDESELVQCSKLFVDLIDKEKYDGQLQLLRIGLEICGVKSQVKIDFKYQGRVLSWKRYVRPQLDLGSILDLIEDEAFKESIGLHSLTFILFPDNTY